MEKKKRDSREVALSLKNCLAYLLEEAMEANLLMVALHMKLALDEAADAADLEEYKAEKVRQAS